MAKNIGEFIIHGNVVFMCSWLILICFMNLCLKMLRSEYETLPRMSSQNFHQDEIGKPILDVILRPGDFLYMPRGYIHQADTLFTETHSLHLTFSSYQQNSMYDFLQVVRKLIVLISLKYYHLILWII